MNADPLDLIGADACRCRSPDRSEIGIEKLVAEVPHGQPGTLAMLEYELAVAYNRKRRVQLMGAAAKTGELLAGKNSIRRFREPAFTKRKRLVGAKNIGSGEPSGDGERLFPGKQLCNLAGVPRGCLRFDRALVDVGGLDDVRNSCCGQESVPDGAAGGEDQWGSPTPQLHVSKRRLPAPFRAVKRLGVAGPAHPFCRLTRLRVLGFGRQPCNYRNAFRRPQRPFHADCRNANPGTRSGAFADLRKQD